MRKGSLLAVKQALEGSGGEVISIAPEIAAKAAHALRKMIAMAGAA
jgi:quinolinate synthase